MVRAKDVEVEELVELGLVEVQRRLVLCHACVCDHAVEAPLFGDDAFDGAVDGRWGRDVARDVVEAVRVLLRDGVKFGVVGSWLEEIQAVDVGC